MARPQPNPHPDPNPVPNPNPNPICGRRVFHVHFGHGYVASLETREEVDAPSQAEQALSSRTQVLPASAYCPSACCPPALLPASPYYPCAPPTTPPLRLSLAYSSAYPSAYRPLQDINVVFDAPKYTHTMKLRAFYAVRAIVSIAFYAVPETNPASNPNPYPYTYPQP